MADVNYSILTENKERVVGSINPENPNSPRTITVTKGGVSNTYRQNMDSDDPGIRGKFFSTKNGVVWDGEPAAGNSVREAQAQQIDNQNVSDAIKENFKEQNAANPNLKSDTEGGDTEGGKDKGSSTTFGDATNAGPKIKKRTYDDLRYPEAQLSKDADYMQILMLEYVPGKFKRGNRASERQMNTLGSVILPIPPGLADNNQVSWNQHQMNALQMGGAAAAIDVMNSNKFLEATGEKASQMLENAKNNSGELGNAAKLMLTGQIPGINASTNQLLARNQGQIINPNMEVLFNGPAIRSFSYTFRLTARNEKETGTIRKIIRFFKQGMSVKRSSGESIYLDSPNIFQPSFHTGSKEHPFLYKMKRTALTGFVVNYVPDGTYMTLPNSSMTAYEIRLDMQELDPIFDEDYANDNDTTIGF